MRVLVTGGNGLVGSGVVRTLVHEGHEARCLLRPTSQTERLDGVRYDTAMGDVRDDASIKTALVGCDAVIHLASLSAWAEIDCPLIDQVVAGAARTVLARAA